MSPHLEGLVFRLVQEALAALVQAPASGPLYVSLHWSGRWVHAVVEAAAVMPLEKELEMRPGWLAARGRIEFQGGAASVARTPYGNVAIWAAIPAAAVPAS